MDYRGRIKNGVVEFEEPVPLPEGTEVNVGPADTLAEDRVAVFPEIEGEIPTLYEQFKDIIGIANDLPEDMAENHDHYIHGTPKK
jgi:hypothetical protein